MPAPSPGGMHPEPLKWIGKREPMDKGQKAKRHWKRGTEQEPWCTASVSEGSATTHRHIRAFATLSQQRTLAASRSEQGRFGALARYPRYRDCAHSRTNHRTSACFAYHVFMHILSMFPWPVQAIFREGEVSRGGPGTEQ
uniref:Uncharacterized protein n=1 Tax=Anopheles coluzzii TaxID=1518534 RepID=A0A8W7PKV6_ANOCL